MERTNEHVKNYRPQILVLTGNPAARTGLIDFANSITKGSSLLINGYIIPFQPSNSVFKLIKTLNEYLRDWLHFQHIKAFQVTVANQSFRTGCQSLIQVCFFINFNIISFSTE